MYSERQRISGPNNGDNADHTAAGEDQAREGRLNQVPEAQHVRPPPRRDTPAPAAIDEITPNNIRRETTSSRRTPYVSRMEMRNDPFQRSRPQPSLRRERESIFQPTRSAQIIPLANRNREEFRGHATDQHIEGNQGDQCLQQLREELSNLKEKFNEKKAMLNKAMKDIEKYEMNNNALITMYNRLEQERDELKMENTSLKSLNAAIPRRKVPKVKYSSELPVMFQGIANSLSRNILGWCDRETKELEVMGDALQRNWHRRSEKAVAEGIPVSNSSRIVPTSPLKIADRRQYYTPSFQNEKEMLMMMLDEEMSSTMWASHFPTEQHKDECRKTIGDDMRLKAQVKQTLSDRLSTRKRNARDKLFQFLGYFLLLSRKAKCANEQEENERNAQKKEIHDKFMVKYTTAGDEEMYDFSVWRTEQLSKLACSTYSVSDTTEIITGDLLFKHNMSLHVLHEFRGHNIEENPDFISSILTLARLDSWIMTLAECMNMEDGRGGRRQKAFNQLYYKFLPMATRQLLENICYNVWKENSEELVIRCSAEDRREDPFENDRRNATKILQSRADDCCYITVRADWFQDNISKYLGNVCDCYIGEGKRDGQLFLLYGMEAQEATEYVADTEEAREVPNSCNSHFARFRL